MNAPIARERCTCGATFEFNDPSTMGALVLAHMKRWRNEHHHDPKMSTEVLELVTALADRVTKDRDTR